MQAGQVTGHGYMDVERAIRVRENEGRAIEQMGSYVGEDGRETVFLRFGPKAESAEWPADERVPRGWAR